MQFRYQESFEADPPEAYEKIVIGLLDWRSDTVYRHDEAIEQWRFVTDILEAWETNPWICCLNIQLIREC